MFANRCRDIGPVLLFVALRPFFVGALLLFLFPLTLGVGVLVLCDRKLRVKNVAALIVKRNAALARPERRKCRLASHCRRLIVQKQFRSGYAARFVCRSNPEQATRSRNRSAFFVSGTAGRSLDVLLDFLVLLVVLFAVVALAHDLLLFTNLPERPRSHDSQSVREAYIRAP